MKPDVNKKLSEFAFPIRPRQSPSESYLGYLYRLLVKNRFEAAWAFDKAQELHHKVLLSRDSSVAAFAEMGKIFGREPSESDLLLRQLEHAVFSTEIAISKSWLQFCPECVKENEVHQRSWLIWGNKACDTHRIRLLKACKCGAQFPLVVLKDFLCRHCGESIAGLRTEVCTDAEWLIAHHYNFALVESGTDHYLSISDRIDLINQISDRIRFITAWLARFESCGEEFCRCTVLDQYLEVIYSDLENLYGLIVRYAECVLRRTKNIRQANVVIEVDSRAVYSAYEALFFCQEFGDSVVSDEIKRLADRLQKWARRLEAALRKKYPPSIY